MFSSTKSLFFLRHTPFISQFEEGCHKSVSNLFCTLLLLQLLAHICPVYWLFPNNLLSNTNVENVPGKWWCLIMAFNTEKSWKMFLCLKKSILCKYQFENLHIINAKNYNWYWKKSIYCIMQSNVKEKRLKSFNCVTGHCVT